MYHTETIRHSTESQLPITPHYLETPTINGLYRVQRSQCIFYFKGNHLKLL